MARAPPRMRLISVRTSFIPYNKTPPPARMMPFLSVVKQPSTVPGPRHKGPV